MKEDELKPVKIAYYMEQWAKDSVDNAKKNHKKAKDEFIEMYDKLTPEQRLKLGTELGYLEK